MARTYREELFSPRSTNRFIQPQAKSVANPVVNPSISLQQIKQSAQDKTLKQLNGSDAGTSPDTSSPSSSPQSLAQALASNKMVSSFGFKAAAAVAPLGLGAALTGVLNVQNEKTIAKAIGTTPSNLVQSAAGYGASTAAANTVGLIGEDNLSVGKNTSFSPNTKGVLSAGKPDRFGPPSNEEDNSYSLGEETIGNAQGLNPVNPPSGFRTAKKNLNIALGRTTTKVGSERQMPRQNLPSQNMTPPPSKSIQPPAYDSSSSGSSSSSGLGASSSTAKDSPGGGGFGGNKGGGIGGSGIGGGGLGDGSVSA
mgnify:CR=1 FL=1